MGFVSLFMDMSSEMIHALLPLYLVNVLAMSVLTVGFIEGIAEATAMITKVFSGALSDYLGHRKWIVAAGYGLAALTKPVFPLATTAEWLIGARFLDRVGKGIRGAPRDALVSDVAPAELRGAAFGLRQSLDTIGAFLGPLIAIGLMLWTANQFRVVFWVAVVPAFVSLALVVFFVKEPERKAGAMPAPRWRLADVARLPHLYWLVVSVSAVLTIARFSEAFLILKAQNAGIATALVPAIMIVMNVVYALTSYPAGMLADRFGRLGMLVIGIACLIAADALLALGTGIPVTLVGVVLWGLHMGFTQGVFATLVADVSPSALRGTAFGLFNLVGGGAMLVASVLAGALWDLAGPAATFSAGGVVACVGLASLALLRGRLPTAPQG